MKLSSRHNLRALWLASAGKRYPWPVLCAKADLLVVTGRRAEAIAIYRSSLPVLEACGDHHAIGQCLTDQGFALMLQGNFSEAEQLGQRTLALGNDIGNPLITTQALNLLGNIANHLGHFRDSAGHYQSALDIGSPDGLPVDRCTLLKNLGVAHYELGDYSRAVDCQQQCLALAEADGNLLAIGAVYLNLGIIRQRQCDFVGALGLFQRALATLARIGNKDLIRNVHNYLGIVHSRLGELDLAVSHYSDSLALARETGDRNGLATVLNNLGNIHLDRGDYQKAGGDFNECRRLFLGMGHEEGEAVASANLGEVLSELGEYTESDRLYTLAVAYGRKQQAKYYLCHFLSGFADLRARQDRDSEAHAMADEALGLAQELNIPDVSFSCRLLLARLQAKHDPPAAMSQLRQLREECREDEHRALACYWLFKHGRQEDDRVAALTLLRRIDRDPQNLTIKRKLDELQSLAG